jgi:hypothetical protein
MQMASPNPPYFVSFSADPASLARIDHSQPDPGGEAQRAGHTSVDFRGKGAVTVEPETGAARPDGLAPFYFKSVNVYFRITDLLVQISSDYPERSCAYKATLRHEIDEHIVNPTRIMFTFRDKVINALNAVPLPTAKAPRWIRPEQAPVVQKEYMDRVGAVVRDYRKRVSTAMREAQAASDAPARYRLVYGQCPVDEWRRP